MAVDNDTQNEGHDGAECRPEQHVDGEADGLCAVSDGAGPRGVVVAREGLPRPAPLGHVVVDVPSVL